MSEPLTSAFLNDLKAASAEVTIPEGDPMELYLAQVAASADDAKRTYKNVRFGKAKVEDIRRWLARTAAYSLRAYLATFQPFKPVSARDLVSTQEAMTIMQQVTGETYTRQAISFMVKSKELKVAAKRSVQKTGRPQNFYRRDSVLEAANRRMQR